MIVPRCSQQQKYIDTCLIISMLICLAKIRQRWRRSKCGHAYVYAAFITYILSHSDWSGFFFVHAFIHSFIWWAKRENKTVEKISFRTSWSLITGTKTQSNINFYKHNFPQFSLFIIKKPKNHIHLIQSIRVTRTQKIKYKNQKKKKQNSQDWTLLSGRLKPTKQHQKKKLYIWPDQATCELWLYNIPHIWTIYLIKIVSYRI